MKMEIRKQLDRIIKRHPDEYGGADDLKEIIDGCQAVVEKLRSELGKADELYNSRTTATMLWSIRKLQDMVLNKKHHEQGE